MVRWAKSPLEWAGIDPLPPELMRPSMEIPLISMNFHGRKTKFWGKRIDSSSLQWAFRSANHGWKSFLTLNSFPAHSRYFKNLKSTWHKILSCSCQLQTIFWSVTPHLHVLIMIWNVYVSQKDGVHFGMSLCNPLKDNKLPSTRWKGTCIAFIWGRVAWFPSIGFRVMEVIPL